MEWLDQLRSSVTGASRGGAAHESEEEEQQKLHDLSQGLDVDSLYVNFPRFAGPDDQLTKKVPDPRAEALNTTHAPTRRQLQTAGV